MEKNKEVVKKTREEEEETEKLNKVEKDHGRKNDEQIDKIFNSFINQTIFKNKLILQKL